MNVVKSKRKESRFEVLHLAHEIQRELELCIFVDFGVEPKRDLTPDERLYMQVRRDGLRRSCDAMVSSISSANCIKAVTEGDFKQRRKFQNAAITNAYAIEHQCMQVIERIPGININKYNRLVCMLIDEIGLLRKWRNTDHANFKKQLCG